MNYYINRKFNIGSIILSLLLMCSCESQLDVPPTASLDSNYFTQEMNVQMAVSAVYAQLANYYGANFDPKPVGPTLPFQLYCGDDVTTRDASSVPQYEAFSGLDASDACLNRMWKVMYQQIFRANFVLELLERPDVIKVVKTPNMVNYMKGEMLFIRSWLFYQLWDWFRIAPMPLTYARSLAPSELQLPPTSGFELLDQAIEDLNTATDLLPNSWPSEYKGRVFKDSAYGLLVKCYAMKACYNNKNQEDYTKAVESFQKIATARIEGVHYGDNFNMFTENNPESLFEWQCTYRTPETNAWLGNDNSGNSAAYYLQASSHWSATSYGYATVGPTEKLINLFDPGDPRLPETVADSVQGQTLGAEWQKWDYFVYPNSATVGKQGSWIRKYLKYSDKFTNANPQFDPRYNTLSANNYRILRFADVKLVAAEAYLQLGNKSMALQQINDVRRRARLSPPTTPQDSLVIGLTRNGTITQPQDLTDVTMDDIMDERLRELAYEYSIRWTDLRRWHVAGYINLSQWSAKYTPENRRNNFGSTYSNENFRLDLSKNLLFPIPISEINANPKFANISNNGY